MQPLTLHFDDNVATPIKQVASCFAHSVCRDAPSTVLMNPPRRQAHRPPPGDSPAPRRSERLAQKSRAKLSKPELQAQNVLMKRLGISTTEGPPDAAAYSRYVEIFTGHLTPSLCEAMDTLVPEVGPFFSGVMVETEL